jgi:simple sugar transport system permease protein
MNNTNASTEIKAPAEKKVREAFIHITKRDQMVWWKAWLVRAIAILLALIVSGIVMMLMTKTNPVKAFSMMLDECFGTERKTWIIFQETAMLLCIALAVTPAFKMRFWNIGAEGQVLVGCLASAACMFYIKDSIPNAALLGIMIAASVIAGIIWGLIPAFFKAKWNTNETLFTLMMNYVAMQLVSFMIMVWVPNGSAVMGSINRKTKAGWLPELFGQKYFINVAVVAVLVVLMFIYLKYSKQGYEIAVVGESENTAKYIGINVKKVIIRTMAISGALCGVAGFLLVAGTDHSVDVNTAGGNGFTAIIVSWLSKFNPVVMLFASLLLVTLQKGSSGIVTKLRFDASIADIITGIVLFFIIGCEFFMTYKVNFRKPKFLNRAAKGDK